MTQPKTNRIPAPLYAAAGAGELALQQLRKLPTVVSDLGTKVVADFGGKAVVTGFELRQKATETLKTANLTAAGLREKAVPTDLDLDKLREAATRNAAAVLSAAEAAQERALAGAQAAQVRALAAYAELVARGERVVGAGVLEAADTVNADIEATEAAPAATTTPAAPVEAPTPADVAEVVEAKPAAAKTPRTRATKATATKAATAKPAATPSAKLPKATKRTRPAAE
jgi:heparin binding hemagglutinin HbhA